jgi:hypothetical protein
MLIKVRDENGGCEKCPFSGIGAKDYLYCGIEQKQVGTSPPPPDWCPLRAEFGVQVDLQKKPEPRVADVAVQGPQWAVAQVAACLGVRVAPAQQAPIEGCAPTATVDMVLEVREPEER